MLKKTCVAALLGLMAGLPFNASALWTFNYTSPPSGYTQVGTEVSVTGGHVDFNNAIGQSFQRIYYPIGGTLTNSWRMDFEFAYSPNGSSNGFGHYIAVATSNTSDMVCSNIPTSTPSNNDLIGVEFNTPSETSPSGANVAIRAKHGTVLAALSTGILVSPSTLYYLSLERQSAGQIRLSVYSDAARTIHVAGSPVCFTAFDAATGTGSAQLSYLQHGVISWAGLGRTLYGIVDNLTIDNVVMPTLTVSSSQTLCAPGDVPNTLTTLFSPTTFTSTYQWQVFLPYPFNAWVNVSGATGATYNPGSLTSTQQYRCYYTYGCSGAVFFSNVVTITVNQFNPTIDCNVADDYTNPTLWLQSGLYVTDNLAADACVFKGAPNGSTSEAIARSITTLPNDKWRADFEFNYNFHSSQLNHYLTALTSSTLNPGHATQAVVFAKIISGPTNALIEGGSKAGFFGSTYVAPTAINVSTATTYYVSLERLCSTKGRISVFSDAGRTTHMSGSPQYFFIDPTLTGLSYVQHANNIAVSTGTLFANVDNLCIDNNYQFGGHREAAVTGLAELAAANAELVNVFPNPGSGVFTINAGFKDGAQLEVFDIFGRSIQKAAVKANDNYVLDLSGFAKGVYMINVTNQGKVYTKKIVMQ